MCRRRSHIIGIRSVSVHPSRPDILTIFIISLIFCCWGSVTCFISSASVFVICDRLISIAISACVLVVIEDGLVTGPPLLQCYSFQIYSRVDLTVCSSYL